MIKLASVIIGILIFFGGYFVSANDSSLAIALYALGAALVFYNETINDGIKEILKKRKSILNKGR